MGEAPEIWLKIPIAEILDIKLHCVDSRHFNCSVMSSTTSTRVMTRLYQNNIKKNRDVVKHVKTHAS